MLWKDMLKLKLPYFGHLMRRTDSLEKILMLGRLEPAWKGASYYRGEGVGPGLWGISYCLALGKRT